MKSLGLIFDYSTNQIINASTLAVKKGPQFFENGSSEVYLLGAIYNLPEAAGKNCLSDFFSSHQEKAFSLLNGDWIIAYKNKQTNQVFFARNKMGTVPLYYHYEDSKVYVSDRIDFILNKSSYQPEYFPEGLLETVYLGHAKLPDLNSTVFKHIYAVPPSYYLSLTLDQPRDLKLVKYFDFNPNIQLKLKSISDYVTEFRRLYLQSVQRRAQAHEKVAVSLSGGLDSSAIFCSLELLYKDSKIKNRPFGISYTSEKWQNSSEIQYLTDIQTKYDADISSFKIEDHLGFLSHTEEQIKALEIPNLDYIWGLTSEVYCQAKSRGCDSVMTGHWGDQFLFPFHYLLDFVPQGRFILFAKHLLNFKKWFNKSEGQFYLNYILRESAKLLLPSWLTKLIQNTKRNLLRQQKNSLYLPLIQQTGAQSKAELYFTYNTSFKNKVLLDTLRSKYHIQCMEWNYKAAQHYQMSVQFPMLDEDLFQFLLSVPSEVICFKGLPRFLIRKGLSGILPLSIENRNWKADFSEPVNFNLHQDIKKIKDTLLQNSLIKEFNLINTSLLEKKIDKLDLLSDNDCTDSWELADLIGLETWLNTYCGRSKLEKNKNTGNSACTDSPNP